jgi:hypothetical protein
LKAEIRRGRLLALKIGSSDSPFSGRLVIPQAEVERYLREQTSVAVSYGSGANK